MIAMSRASTAGRLEGLATVKVKVGPSTRSTMMRMPTTCSALARYQPGHRYQRSQKLPSTTVSAAALPDRCRPKALRRNLIRRGACPGEGYRRRGSRAAPTATRRGRRAGSARCRRAGTARWPTRARAHRSDTSPPQDSSARDSGAAGELEGDVLFGLSGPGGEAVPGEESQIAAVVAAADLGIETGGGGQRDAQQLQRIVTVEGDVESAALRHLAPRAPVLAREPQQLRDRIAQRAQQGQPLAEAAHAQLIVLTQPEIVVRQIELAGAAGDGAAQLDGIEELRVAQRLQKR